MGKLTEQIGLRIRKQRELLQLTREQLCQYVNISPQFLSEIERGKKGPSSETLVKLCKGLSVSPDYILFGREKSGDVSEIMRMLQGVDAHYLPFLMEHIRAFLHTIAAMNRDET